MPTKRASPALTCCVAGAIALLAPACVHRTASDATAEAAPAEAPPTEAAPSGGDPTTRAPDDGRLRLEPPRHPDPQRGPAENLPEVPRDPSGSGLGVTAPPARANPQSHPGAFQACVDRELSRRGLNAFGDPPGTPAREVDDRYRYVTERYPDIATTCGTSRW